MVDVYSIIENRKRLHPYERYNPIFYNLRDYTNHYSLNQKVTSKMLIKEQYNIKDWCGFLENFDLTLEAYLKFQNHFHQNKKQIFCLQQFSLEEIEEYISSNEIDDEIWRHIVQYQLSLTNSFIEKHESIINFEYYTWNQKKSYLDDTDDMSYYEKIKYNRNLSEDLIRRHKEEINFMCIDFSNEEMYSEDFLMELISIDNGYESNLKNFYYSFCNKVSKRPHLSSDFIRKYEKQMNFEDILMYNVTLTEVFFVEYWDVIPWNILSSSDYDLSVSFLFLFKDMMYWDKFIFKKREKIKEEVIEKCYLVFNSHEWDLISFYCYLSPELLERFKNKINFNVYFNENQQFKERFTKKEQLELKIKYKDCFNFCYLTVPEYYNKNLFTKICNFILFKIGFID